MNLTKLYEGDGYVLYGLDLDNIKTYKEWKEEQENES